VHSSKGGSNHSRRAVDLRYNLDDGVSDQPMGAPTILVLGPHPDLPGGIASVVRTQLESPLAEKYNLRVFPVLREAASKASLLCWLWRAVSRGFGLLFCLLRSRPDCVHIHTASGSSFWALSIAALMCRVLRRCPIIFHIHGGGFGRFIERCSGLKRRWLHASLRRAAAVVVLSRYWQEVLSEIAPAERVHVIENAVLFPETEPRPLGQAPYTILFVGFLEKHKGIYELLEAAAQLNQSHEGQFSFLVAGDEEVVGHRDEVAARHRELELGNVELLGSVRGEALQALYREADIFILPSHTEALPMVILEAMASSLPLVATPVGSLPEVLGPENALFVPPGDATALAEAIVALADDTEGRLKMATENLRLFRDRFRVDRFAQDVEAIYLDILARTK